MKKVTTRFGVYSGLAATIFFLGPMVVSPDSFLQPENMASGEVVGYTTMFLCMSLVFFGVRAHRKEASGGYSFGDGFKAGLLITVVSTVVFYLGNVLVYEVIKPGFLEEFFVFYREYMVENGSSEAEIAQMDSSAVMMTNGWIYAVVMASTTFLMGLVISLISGITLRRSATV
ncbi:DUF4199 domain-containing protein [Cryomorphaceae bacterium]|nr:DUF4199 domain-containing protein [Cryomorphaceae bacterium]